MHRRITGWLLAGFAGLAIAQDVPGGEALGYAIGMDAASRAVVEWCERRSVRDAATLRGKWQAWREANQIESLRAGLDARQRSSLEGSFGEPFGRAIVGKLERAGEPAAACGSLTTFWQTEDMDLRRQYPQLYAGGSARAAPRDESPVRAATPPPSPLPPPSADRGRSGGASASASAGASAGADAGDLRDLGSFDRKYVLAEPAPAGTVYAPSQLEALKRSWWNGRDFDGAMRAMRAHGPLFVRGRVTRRGSDHFYIDTAEDAFQSRLVVSPGFDISMFEGRNITVTGELDELPTAIIFLRKGRLVRSSANLRASTLDDSVGLYRRKVDDAQVAAAPGRGIGPDEVYGVLHHGEGRTTVSGYQFVEEIHLLLKDGTYYDAKSTAPDVLDRRKSRELQPQLWGRWRRAGSGFELQAQDDRGRPKEWQASKGKLLPAWPANHRLAGTWTVQRFDGSIALGGTLTRRSIVFGSDGRFEKINFSNSSSGSLAQTGSDFSASASSHSDGKGSSSSAGGGTGGKYSGASVFVQTEKSSRDGSGNRGSYRLSGRTLTLTYDNGKVEELLCAPWDGAYKNIVLNGATYSRK